MEKDELVWYLLILRGVWKVTLEMSTGLVKEISSSIPSSELRVRSRVIPKEVNVEILRKES